MDRILYLALINLEQLFTGNDVDFVMPLGDNWLITWNWAEKLEQEHGINHQDALRAAYARYFAARIT